MERFAVDDEDAAAAPPPLGAELEKVRVALSQLSMVLLPPPIAVAVENTFLDSIPKECSIISLTPLFKSLLAKAC